MSDSAIDAIRIDVSSTTGDSVQKLRDVAEQLERIKTASGKATSSVKDMGSATGSTSNSLATLKSKLSDNVIWIGKLGAGVATLTTLFNTLKNALAAPIRAANTYIEDMNLFTVSMGRYAEQALAYGKEVQESMGIDLGNWARNQGVFMTLITGMGESADKAAVMSQQLTQLGYDIASFYNIRVEDAMLKIQSGIAGELEPLRRIGWDLSDTRMQLEATTDGIDESTKSMTQAEKVALRYEMIMTQVTQVHGDMARTINSPANMLRVLRAQMDMASREIGNLFIPALNLVLPYLIAVAKAIRIVAVELQNLFGISAGFEFDYSNVDYSGISAGAEAFDDAAGAAGAATKAAKEYKNTVMGFDELNKLNAVPDPSGGSGGAGGGIGGAGGFDIPLTTYEFMAGLDKSIAQRTDEIARKLVDLAPIIAMVGAGLGAIFTTGKVARFLGLLAPTTAALMGVATAASVGGVALADMWNNGTSKANVFAASISQTVLGAFGAVTTWLEKLAKMGEGIKGIPATFATWFEKLPAGVKLLGKVAGAIGVIFDGIGLIAGGREIFESIGKGADISNTSLIEVGTSIMGIGIALSGVTGGVSLLVAAVVTAAGGLAAGLYDVRAKIAYEWSTFMVGVQTKWGNVCDYFSNRWSESVEEFKGIWAGITSVFTTVTGAISNFVKKGDDLIASWVSRFLDKVKGLITNIKDWWNGLPEFFEGVADGLEDGLDTLVANVTDVASGCLNTIQTTFKSAVKWFQTNVVNPLGDLFSSLWNRVVVAAQMAWSAITSVFSGGGSIVSGVADGLTGAMKSVVNACIDALNAGIATVFDGLNTAMTWLKDAKLIGWAFSAIPTFEAPVIPKLATGGLVDSGQLFIARERGPEMVGRMGAHTTVANNDQIVSAIEGGVMRAILRAGTMGTNEQPQRDIVITMNVGSEQLAKAVYRGNQSLIRQGVIRPQFS